MARRNLSNRADIPADSLRQRRDLYALAIGLSLFYAADGALTDTAGLGSLSAIHLGRAWFVLLAAWLGFFYFWWRFWLISEARPFRDFVEDVRWQAGNSRAVRTVASKYVMEFEGRALHAQRGAVLSRTGPVPLLYWERVTPYFDLSAALRRANKSSEQRVGVPLGTKRTEVAPEDYPALRWAWIRGMGGAILRERAFSDYTAPHLFALLTCLIAAGVIAHRGTLDVTKPRGTPEAVPKVAPETAPRQAPKPVQKSPN